MRYRRYITNRYKRYIYPAIITATSKGLYWSRNGGATWVTRYNNSAVGEFQALATDGAVLLAGTSKGLFASRNQGMTWERRM